MSALESLQLLAALASALAAGWLWASRSRFYREALAARDELLRAKDAVLAAQAGELAALRELTPIRIREFLETAHAELKDFCQAVEAGHRAARKEVDRCNAEITRIQDQGDWKAGEIDRLVSRREALLAVARAMKPGLRLLQHQCEFPEPFSLRVARIHPATVQALAQAYRDLAGQLALAPAELGAQSERVIQACKHRLDENTLFSSALFAPAEPGPVWQRPDNGE